MFLCWFFGNECPSLFKAIFSVAGVGDLNNSMMGKPLCADTKKGTQSDKRGTVSFGVGKVRKDRITTPERG